MTNQKFNHPIQEKSRHTAIIGYVMILLWFLLTVMTPRVVHAEETPAPITLTASDILPDIEAALSMRGMPADAEISLSNPAQAFVTYGEAAIEHVSYNNLSGRFVIRLSNTQTAITGVARVSRTFPVLAAPLARGERITESNITFVELKDGYAGQHITNTDEIIGMEARRPLRANLPIRKADITTPVLIKKGALVTVTYIAEGLRLTHQGVALNAGGEGDLISVQNIQSERTLKGVIAGKNLVSIATPHAFDTPAEG